MQESKNQSVISPAFSSLEEVQSYLKSNQKLWELFHLLSPKRQQELLDVFQKIVHDITKSSTLLEAWLMFLSAANTDFDANFSSY